MTKSQVLFILLFLISPLGFASDATHEMWLRQTSVTNHLDCQPANTSLYRAVGSKFMPLSRVVQMMLGEEQAELPSWRLSAILKENFGENPTLENYHVAKELAATELAERLKSYKYSRYSICQFANESSSQTLRGGSSNIRPAELQNALGIASANTYEIAYSYSVFQPSNIIEIREHIARATRSPDYRSEYFFPIIIPAEDVVRGWSSTLQIEKASSPTENILIQIFAHQPDKPVKKFSISAPENPNIDRRLIATVERCNPDELCSEVGTSKARIKDLDTIITAISRLRSSGQLVRIRFIP